MASDFNEAYRNRHQLAETWKRDGRKVFGYFCNYTPEEIIHAAGILPVRVRGATENVDRAGSIEQHERLRSVFELVGRYSRGGKQVLGLLNLLIDDLGQLDDDVDEL